MSGECSHCGETGWHIATCPRFPDRPTLTFERVAADWKAREAQQFEAIRQDRHHDVLCIALEPIIAAAIQRDVVVDVTACVAAARIYADTAYPPPEKTP